MRTLKILAMTIVFAFAAIGFLFTSVYIAMEFGWFNVRGSIEGRNNSILGIELPDDSFFPPRANLPGRLIQIGTSTDSREPDISCTNESVTCEWAETREWNVVAGGLEKDLEIINRVAKETGVSPRLIAAVVVPEQIRFFTSDREVFKRYFEPLKILGSLSKFSLGVSGIKQETAQEIEKNTLNPDSPFYPGGKYAVLFAYAPDTDPDEELFYRLTDEKNHYYSYLYTAVFIKEILSQWERAGFDISKRPDIIATIFNLGFAGSNPNPDPQVGGTWITVGGNNYSFGNLAGQFYFSQELPALK